MFPAALVEAKSLNMNLLLHLIMVKSIVPWDHLNLLLQKAWGVEGQALLLILSIPSYWHILPVQPRLQRNNPTLQGDP